MSVTSKTTMANSAARVDTEAARQHYNAITNETAHYGSILINRICSYDAMAHMIMSRNTDYRLQFVAGLKSYLQQEFDFALNNPEDATFRRQFDRFFDNIRSDSYVAPLLQMFLIHMAILLETEVRNWLCPPCPDPDAVNAEDRIDQSDVDRRAFDIYEQQYLLSYYSDLLSSSIMSVPRLVRELNAVYTALLPPDPLAYVLRDNSRRILFEDEEAVSAVEAKWGPGGRLFKKRTIASSSHIADPKSNVESNIESEKTRVDRVQNLIKFVRPDKKTKNKKTKNKKTNHNIGTIQKKRKHG